jgi:hypothetical protein
MVNFSKAANVAANKEAYRYYTDMALFGDQFPEEMEELLSMWRECCTIGEFTEFFQTYLGEKVYCVHFISENGAFTGIFNPELNGSVLGSYSPLVVLWTAF